MPNTPQPMTEGERLRETSAASAPAAAIPVDQKVLRRVEANMEWLLAAARPHCGSEPESYGISDAEDALAELQGILRGVAPDG